MEVSSCYMLRKMHVLISQCAVHSCRSPAPLDTPIAHLQQHLVAAGDSIRSSSPAPASRPQPFLAGTCEFVGWSTQPWPPSADARARAPLLLRRLPLPSSCNSSTKRRGRRLRTAPRPRTD
eukprot:11350152-Alexandrium_andersonii.AAC.1